MAGLTCIYLLIKALKPFLQTIFPILFARFIKPQPLSFLELDFPAYTDKSAYATEQLYALIHTLARRKTFIEGLTAKKKQFSLEIVSTKQDGIRYLLVVPANDADILRRSLLSYLPGIKIKEVNDYITNQLMNDKLNISIAELKLSSHFALPLNKQKALSEHDPISYLTGHMTGLEKDGLVAFQVITTPVLNSIHTYHVSEMHKLRQAMQKQEPLTPILQKNLFDQLSTVPVLSLFFLALKAIWKVFSFALMFVYSMFLGFIDPNSKTIPFLMTTQALNNAFPSEILNPYEQELRKVVKEKIDKQSFEVAMRILMMGKSPEKLESRMSGIVSSFGMMDSIYQTLILKSAFGFSPLKRRFIDFQNRVLSSNTGFNPNPILSSSELSDIYHFPYTETTKTEDMVKVYSKDLPAPLSLKKGKKLDVVFGINKYGNRKTDIGLTDEDRSRHVYMIGQTGSGKSTVIYHMASDDIQKGRGVAVVDPHGDLVEDLLAAVPESRINDFIYFNPFDVKHPVGINLLELTPTLDEDDRELEKELVCESVISIFRKVFSKDENVDAHRIEYILRNAIYTAFTVNEATIFTVYDLLNNPDFQKSVTKNLEDENLKNFWKHEFGRAGNYQIVKMVSGVTARVGRFLFSPTAKRILEQSHSTVNFDQILKEGKILLCNLAEGKLGEDTSQLLGTTVIAKIQQAAHRRVRIERSARTPFYLFIDEFQNFATAPFTKLLSGGRKFGLRITIAEQSTSQQSDRDVVNVILANTGTVMSFRTASPVDEALMLPQFEPYVSAGDLANLPRYHFYIKLSAVTPEEPFSGETLPIRLVRDEEKIKRLIEASRNNYAIKYQKPEVKKAPGKTKKEVKNEEKNEDVGSLV